MQHQREPSPDEQNPAQRDSQVAAVLLQLQKTQAELEQQHDKYADMERQFKQRLSEAAREKEEIQQEKEEIQHKLERYQPRTARELLAAPLPAVTVNVNQTRADLPSAKLYMFQPLQVKLWKTVKPTDSRSQPLDEAIQQQSQEADDTYRVYPRTLHLENCIVDNEVGVGSAVQQACQNLTELVQQSGSTAGWVQQYTSHITTAGVVAELSGTGASSSGSNQSGPTHISTRPHLSRDRQAPKRYSHDDEVSPSKAAQHRFDMLLRDRAKSAAPAVKHARRSLDQDAATAATSSIHASEAAAAAPDSEGNHCIGELKPVELLMQFFFSDDTGKWQPIELLKAWEEHDHKYHVVARAIVSQLYTYLWTLKITYGYLSCYLATWLAHSPSCDPGTLYLSEPILWDTKSTSNRPATTAMGALAWLQQLSMASDDTFVLPAIYLSNTGNAGGDDSGGGEDDGAHQDPKGDDDYTPETDTDKTRKSAGGRSSGGGRFRGRQNSSGSSSTTGGNQLSNSRGGHAKQLAASTLRQRLHLGRQICPGCAGPVHEADYQGIPAVAKLLHPDSEGDAAYLQETHTLQQLQPVQGKLVPKLLECGKTSSGVSYIVTQRIEGQTLASYESVPKPVAAAALAALKSLAEAFPGFLHGDIRLQNVMCVTDSDDAAPACMWIDFGNAKTGGTTRQQLAEQTLLKRLLGM